MFYSVVLRTYLCYDLIGEMNEYRLGNSYIDKPLGMQVLKMAFKRFLMSLQLMWICAQVFLKREMGKCFLGSADIILNLTT